MARGSNRQLADDDDDLDYPIGAKPMSPNSKKIQVQKLIQESDLGNRTADAIKTSDYTRPRASNMPIVRKCDMQGTEEAKIAAEKRNVATLWCKWGQTEEAQQTASADAWYDGNTHRSRMKASLEASKQKLGGHLTLDDTYDERPIRRPVPKSTPVAGRSASRRRPPDPVPSRRGPSTPAPTTQGKKQSPEKRRAPAVQSRVRPSPAPEALLHAKANERSEQRATPAPASASSSGAADAPTGLKAQVGNVDLLSTPSSTGSTVRARNAPTAPRMMSLVDPSTFMSLANQVLSGSVKGKEKKNIQATPSASNFGGQDASAATSTIPNAGTGTGDNESIIKIPVSEFIFSANGALASNDITTHTDGAPSPGALSGFSTSLASNEIPPHDVDMTELTTALVGLGISGATTGDTGLRIEKQTFKSSPAASLSPTGSLMDSPVPDNLGGDVLVAGNGEVTLINGVRYVPESQLLVMKSLLEKLRDKETIMGIGDKSPGFDMSIAGESTNGLPIRSNPSMKVNPFSAREPVAEEGEVFESAPSSPIQETQSSSQIPVHIAGETFDESLAAAVRLALTKPLSVPVPETAAEPVSQPVSKRAGQSITKSVEDPLAQSDVRSANISTSVKAVASTKETPRNGGISKWAVLSATSTSSSAPALQPKSTNGETTPILSKAGKRVSETRQSATPATVKTPSESLIGDGRVFGHSSKYATNAPRHEFAPRGRAPVRKRHAPGAGYALLLQDLDALKASTKQGTSQSPEKEI